jgi:hypothetical protein
MMLPDLLNRLSHVHLYEPQNSAIRIRRAYISYRLRHLEAAERDFTSALESSSEGGPVQSLDALRGRALIRYEMQ